MECLTTKHYKYMDLEKRYHMIYPESSNATYTSLLNYSDDLNKPFQRWYRYKEGFSTEMVEQLIREYSIHKKGVILDPFSGSGSTLLAAAHMGYQGVGFEVNPFSCFLSRCKLESCSGEEREQFREAYERILEQASETEQEYVLPGLSISHKVFEKQVEAYFMRAGQLMETDLNLTEKVRNLLKLGWLSCLEPLSHYRKAGNGLKIKKYVKPRVVTPEDARNMLLEEYRKIYADLQEHSQQGKTKLYQDSCLNMNRYLEEKSVEGIIFSPPYANCFDYTEIYKLELWFGKFVSDYGDLKRLRNQSLHSHLNGDLSPEPEPESEILEELLEELQAALRPNPEKTVYCQQSLFEPEGLSGELLALLDFTPKPLDLLQEAYHRAYQTRIPVPRLCHGLLQLCADGYAGQNAGAYYRKSGQRPV